MGSAPSYLRDAEAIYALSFERVRASADLSRFPYEVEEILVRLIHASGMPDLTDDILFSENVGEQAIEAIASGKPIFCDSAMVAAGITKRFLPHKNKIIVTLDDKETFKRAEQLKTTRSAAAVEAWRDDLEGSVVAIGNAPTALFHLLEGLAMGWQKPAAILAFPVGFVGAAEAKAHLAETCHEAIGFITLSGTRGGSAMAAAAVNAIALLSVSGGKP